jgi:demethylmenaquinone methyltransferase / 2-methoxy-6-polyprenyl-1,4-benzoquinol methylase
MSETRKNVTDLSSLKADLHSRKEQDPEKIRSMFDRISPTYDLLNRTLTLGIDRHWRKVAVKALGSLNGAHCLDICCGTGDMAFEVARHSKGAFAEIQALDFSEEMLTFARAKLKKISHSKASLSERIEFQRGDAEELPFEDGRFDVALVAFGIRNVSNIPQALSEAARVLKPGGRFAILEFSMPTSALIGALYRVYFRQILPRIGALFSGDAAAYHYLNESAEAFPARDEFAKVITSSGFSAVEVLPITFGLVTVYLATV